MLVSSSLGQCTKFTNSDKLDDTLVSFFLSVCEVINSTHTEKQRQEFEAKHRELIRQIFLMPKIIRKRKERTESKNRKSRPVPHVFSALTYFGRIAAASSFKPSMRWSQTGECTVCLSPWYGEPTGGLPLLSYTIVARLPQWRTVCKQWQW